MPDLPNTNTAGQVLLSQGNGTNASYWGQNAQGWESLGSGGTISAVTVNTTVKSLLTVSVGGFTNYLVTFNFHQNNSATTGTGAVFAQIQDDTTAALATFQVGFFLSTTTSGHFGGSCIVTSANYGNQPFTLSLNAYTSANSIPISYANLTVIGIN